MKSPAGYKFKDWTKGYANLPLADLERLADDLQALAITLDTSTKQSWITEDKLNAVLTVIQWRRDARNRNPASARMQPKLSGPEVVRLMRAAGVTIAQLAARMNIPQTRVRAVRAKGVTGAEYVRDWREGITGVDPGPQYGINPVPASTRAGRKLPAGSEVEQAADLYSRFSGHEPESIGKVTAPRRLKTAIAIGECDGILYTTVRDNRVEKYIHKFRAKDKPLLTVAPDGSQIVLVGGNYTFTERGIIDHSDTKNWKD